MEIPVASLNMTIDELDLSVRSFNCLKRAGIDTVCDLFIRLDEGIQTIIVFQLHANDVSKKNAYVGTFISGAIIIALVMGCGYLATPLIDDERPSAQASEATQSAEEIQMMGGLKEDLFGIWVAKEYEAEDQVRIMLENIDFYEEEIALVDLGSFAIQKTFIFTENDRYYMGIGRDVTEQYCYEFFEGVFADLYSNRTRLNKVYERV